MHLSEMFYLDEDEQFYSFLQSLKRKQVETMELNKPSTLNVLPDDVVTDIICYFV
jgi:hypothetical protein